MNDIGESLVAAYLRYVRGCSVVVLNSFLADQQGEVDVVGIEPVSNSGGHSGKPVPQTVWFCEVTTHVGGFNDAMVRKVPAKLQRLKAFAETSFPGDRHHFEWWSPRARPGVIARVEEAAEVARGEGMNVSLVFNGVYTARINELQKRAARDPKPTAEPAYRLLQILGHMRAPEAEN